MKIYMLILSLFFISPAWAAGENMFGLTKVVFFDNSQVEVPKVINSEKTIVDSWMEPVIGPGGKLTYYTPPQEVKDFLNNPSLETAEKYLEWNSERFQKLAMAQDVLNILTERNRNNKQDQMINQIPHDLRNRWREGRHYIAFFLIKGCPYCEQQKQTILELQKNHPQDMIDVFVKGYNPAEMHDLPFTAKDEQGLTKELGLSKYPSAFIISKSGHGLLIPGLITRDHIENILKETP